MRSSFRIASLLLAFVGGCGVDGNRGTFQADLSVPPDMAMGGATLDPGVVSKSVRTLQEAETHVMAADNGFVAVAYIGIFSNGFSSNGYTFSKDDGETWEPPQTLDSPGKRVSSDPVLAVDAQNNFYMTWIGYRITQGGTTDMHVYVARAPAGTTTFEDPIEVSEPPNTAIGYDKPWITIANDGAVLITYAQTSPSSVIFAARSGIDPDTHLVDVTTWANSVISSDQGFRNLVFPCHPSTGSRMYAVYHSGGGIGLRWSEDNGVNWDSNNKTAVAAQGERPAFEDPTCAAEGDEVWITYGLSQDQFNSSSSAKLNAIRLAHSADGGKSIDNRYDAHDPDAASYFIHPYVVREAATGALDLIYYAGNAENDTMGSFRRSRSTDGGMTWNTSVVVHEPITYLAARDSMKWLGDYSGLWWTRNNLYISYVDNHATSTHVAFHRTAAPPL